MDLYVKHEPPLVRWKTVTVHDPPPLPQLQTTGMVKQPMVRQAENVFPSPDGTFLGCVDGGTLTVVDAKTGAVVRRTTASHPIIDVVWIRDRLLFYVTSANQLVTFDVLANRVRPIYTSDPPAGQTFRALAFSDYTNDVFFIYGSAKGNTVYQFDTNEHVWATSIGAIGVQNAYYGTTSKILYLDDAKHNLYQLNGGYLQRISQRAAILRGAGNSLFYADLNKLGQAIAVEERNDSGQTRLVCRLEKPAPVADVVIDHAGKVFVAAGDVVENEMERREWRVPSGYQLRVAGHDILLIRGATFRVVVD